MRNVPIMTWVGAEDEGSPASSSEESVAALGAAGLRFVHDMYLAADHLTPYTNDQWGPAAEFLGEHRVVRDPPHVSYVVDKRNDFPAAGVVADHAYWLSEARVRNPSASPVATFDARSQAFGVGDPKPLGTQSSTRTLEGGRKGPMPYLRREQWWGPAPAAPKADVLVLEATNLGSITVDMRRARLSCQARLDVTTDGPLTVHLGGCGTTRSFA